MRRLILILYVCIRRGFSDASSGFGPAGAKTISLCARNSGFCHYAIALYKKRYSCTIVSVFLNLFSEKLSLSNFNFFLYFLSEVSVSWPSHRILTFPCFSTPVISCFHQPACIVSYAWVRFATDLRAVESNYAIAIATLGDWFRKVLPVYQPMRRKTKTNRDLHAQFFPALWASYMELLRVWIGSLRCLHLLWLVKVITWVFVLRYSIENLSNNAFTSSICFSFYNIDRIVHALWLVKNPCFIRV